MHIFTASFSAAIKDPDEMTRWQLNSVRVVGENKTR
jgi:hypothetical protein